MTKNVSIFLLCALLLVGLSGCAIFNHFWSSPEVPTAPTDPTQPTTPHVVYNNPMNLPVELLDVLRDYLDSLRSVGRMVVYPSAEQKINFINNGNQALHVAFDSSNYYFVCGYYNDDHKQAFTETNSYCCSAKYEWIKFDRAEEIQEYYNGATMVVAFQINKALFVKNISVNTEETPDMEHFRLYTPEFIEGLNGNAPADFAETFIYINYDGKSKVYHSMDHYLHKGDTFPCVRLNDRYYIPVQLYLISATGQRTENNLSKQFGKYYDAIESIMEIGKYSVTLETGKTAHYGLLPVDGFASKILK